MARPIKETPTLYGKAARKFEEEMQRVENMTREERKANRKKVEEGCSAFLKTVKVAFKRYETDSRRYFLRKMTNIQEVCILAFCLLIMSHNLLKRVLAILV